MTSKPMKAALVSLDTQKHLRNFGSHAKINVSLGPMEADRIVEEESGSSQKYDYATAVASMLRNGTRINPSASSSAQVPAVLPTEDDIYRGVIYGFLLGTSFFLLTRYIKRRFLA